MNYLDGMTAPQQTAILCDDCCNIITAGAGAGKTEVMTRKIQHRLARYTNSAHKQPIVAITFTNDAAKEISERVKRKVGEEQGKRIVTSTFHRFAIHHVIKPFFSNPFFKKAGLRIFSIASGRDVYYHLKQAEEKGLSVKQKNDFKSLESTFTLDSWLSLIRAKGFSPESYFAANKDRFLGVVASLNDMANYNERPTLLQDTDRLNFYFLKMWKVYVDLHRKNSLVDLDEILVLATDLIEQDRDVRITLKRRYPEIMVDEFQDVNFCQFKFVLMLAHNGRNLSLFGDVKQAIYGFRGSDPYLFKKMLSVFSHAQVLSLPHNFRSVQQVVDVGNALASNMSLLLTNDPMIAGNTTTPIEPVIIRDCTMPSCESEWIATKIQWLRNQGIEYKDIGILYRFKRLGDVLENEFIQRRMPFRRVGGSDDRSLYEDERVVDIVKFLHLLFRPTSKHAMSSFLSSHAEFGIRSQDYTAMAKQHGFKDSHHAALSYLLNQHFNRHSPAWSVLNAVASTTLLLSPDLERVKTFDEYCRSHNAQFLSLSAAAKQEVRKKYGPAYEKAVLDFVTVLKDAYCQFFYLPFATDDVRQSVVQRDRERITDDFDAIFSYLFGSDRLTSEDMNVLDYICSRPLVIHKSDKKDEENMTDIEMQTVHASKGKEKKVIFIVGCSNDTWFKDMNNADPASLTYQEELRLFYVAVTRAQMQLYITRHEQYLSRGQLYETDPLSFLDYLTDLHGSSVLVNEG
ncbi:ATP-dependent helicase [Vibrio sp. Hal054]|uniref:ATP-dependent helicase n=1 Tax=Vibrio sp. Hal054 TaxID=3035158 RepID=UPI00301C6F72